MQGGKEYTLNSAKFAKFVVLKVTISGTIVFELPFLLNDTTTHRNIVAGFMMLHKYFVVAKLQIEVLLIKGNRTLNSFIYCVLQTGETSDGSNGIDEKINIS